MEIRLSASILVAAIFLADTALASGEEANRSGFWGGVDIGAGHVDRSVGNLDVESTDFYLGLKAGYVVHPQALVGLELSGWNQEATDRDDPTNGEGLMQAFLISRLYPIRDYNLFAKVGGGWVRQWVNDPAGGGALDGWGATVGLGYDYPVGKSWAVTPFFNYGFGKAEDQKHQTFTLGVGITFY